MTFFFNTKLFLTNTNILCCIAWSTGLNKPCSRIVTNALSKSIVSLISSVASNLCAFELSCSNKFKYLSLSLLKKKSKLNFASSMTEFLLVNLNIGFNSASLGDIWFLIYLSPGTTDANWYELFTCMVNTRRLPSAACWLRLAFADILSACGWYPFRKPWAGALGTWAWFENHESACGLHRPWL